MDYGYMQQVVRKTFMDVLPLSGEHEALEASRRMADWLGADATTASQMADTVADDWNEFRRQFVLNG